MNAEKNSVQVEKLAILSLAPPAPTAQLIAAETKLAENLLLNPEIEIVEDEELEMPTDEEIVAKVQHDLAVERGDIIVIDDDDDEEEEEGEEELHLTTSKGIALIQKLEVFLTSEGDQMVLVPQLQKLRGGLFREVQAGLVQKPLEAFFARQ
ncbi:hypothetical protein B0H14DRAFT_2561407 [Mycena olivaceomarginata]|nr:hypothetical protein B0H14DRAFT_2561407 [Mycena olivaceomarginata]